MSTDRSQVTKEQLAAALNILVLVIIAALLKDVIRPVTGLWYKLGAGFVLGTYGAFGKELTKVVVKLAWSRRLDILDKNRWTRPFTLFSVLLLIIGGIFSWAVGWEGNTNIFYGFGVLVGMTAFDFGIARVIAIEYAIDSMR